VAKPVNTPKPVPLSASAGRPSDLLHKDVAKNLAQEVKQEPSKETISREQAGVNLIQKAHDLYRPPTKVVTIKPAANVNGKEFDLPTIDEAEQKEEQNTFANGMPLGAMLMGRVKNNDTNSVVLKTRDGVRSSGVQKMIIKSAEPKLGKVEKLKLYREPNEEIAKNLEKIREYKQRAMMLAYGIHETNTPQKENDKRSLHLVSHQNSQRSLLPAISSTKASESTGVNSNRLGLIRYNGRNETDFSNAVSVNADVSKDKENIVRESLLINPLIAKY
jgi:hypothetical protein